MVKEEFIKSFDKTKIFTYTYDKVKNPKGVILIVHGMAEHAKRYSEFAEFLNKNSYIVFCFDLRAHGKTANGIENLGKYKDDLFEHSVCDIMFFSNYLHEKYNLPLYVLGHSFGSFLLQRYIEIYQNYDAVIFSGSANMKNQLSVSLGLMVARMTKLFCGKNHPAKMIAKLSFGSYEKHFENKNWLTSDEKIFEEYQKDDYCGFVCSANFYCSFFKNLKKIYKYENLAQINCDKPMLILSGAKDAVGGFGKLAKKLKNLYEKIGVKNINFKLYDEMRHEILNETNKQEVFDDILNFLKKQK
ncbi:MAG: alpha/beta hydrolase [Clostridia bacterium]|nr:alpha/beta hydrolase [Clostridia bacterium]